MKFKRAVALCMAALETFCLSACSSVINFANATPKPTPTETPQYLWTTEYTEVEKTSYTLSPLFFSGDGFYACGMEVTGEDIPEDVINEAKREHKDVVNDGRYNIYENRLCFIGLDGRVTQLQDYSQMELPENTKDWNDYSATTNIGGVVENDGELYSIEYTYASGNSKPEDPANQIAGKNYNEFSTAWYIRQLNSDGKELKCTKVDTEDCISFVQDSFHILNGTFIAISVSDGKNGIACFTKDGKLLNNTMTAGTIDKLIILGNGAPAAVCNDGSVMQILLYNMDDGTLEQFATVESGSLAVSGNGDADFYYSNGLDFVSYKGGTENTIFNWSGVNVNPNKISSDICIVNSDSCCFMTSEGEIVSLNKIGYDSSAERKTLIIAAKNPSDTLLNAVSAFNQTHYDVKIEVEDYSIYSEGQTGEKAIEMYSYNHLGGQMPDIIDLTDLPYVSMANEGKLENLYPYIDSDVQLSRDDLISSVIETLEVNGGLYCTASCFSINTVLGSTNVVGPDIGWTYSDYYDALISMGAGTDGFDSFTSKDEMLKEMLYMDMDSYIDWNSLTCNFTDGKFYNLLCYLNTFPENIDYAEYSEQEKESSDLRLRNGRQMLQILTLYGIDDVLRAGYEFSGDTTFIGYPTDFGTGNTVDVFTFEGNGNLAMTSTCTDKQAAWEFLRTFFTEEYQENSNCFPINKNLFENRLEEAMILTPVLSKKGEQLYDDDGEPRYYEVGTMYLSDFTAVPYYPLTEERSSQLKDLINTTTKKRNCNEDIYRIVKDSMNGDNVCETVQSKVTEYLQNLN